MLCCRLAVPTDRSIVRPARAGALTIGQTRLGVNSVMQSSRWHFLMKLGAHQTQLWTVATRGPNGPVSRGAGAGVDAHHACAPAAAARWSGPVSLEITRSDSAANAASSHAGSFRPQRSRTGTGPRSSHELIDERPVSGRADGDQARTEFMRQRDGRSPRNVRGGQRLVSHRAPTLSTILGDRTRARTSLAHRRSASRIGRLNRGCDASHRKARATRWTRSTACRPSRGASTMSV